MKKQGWLALMTTGVLFTAGCGPDALKEERARPVIERYAALTYENYGDVVTQAKALLDAVRVFVSAPTQARLETARKAWLASRDSYGQSEAFRFYGGPIDDDKDGLEGQINSWPLDEMYIDGGAKSPNQGLVNSSDTLTTDLLVSANERGGETNIATGYHAIEYLLWGQDTSATGPGNRPYTDYLDNGTAPNAARRRQYLLLVTDLLVENLETVQAAWAPGQDNYRKAFSAEAPKEAVLKMLTGLGALSGAELAGERMTVAYDNKDQEDEHSCFSDNTPADLYNNALGIQNVYLGRYGKSDGAGLNDLVAGVDPKLDEKMQQRMQASLDAIRAIPAPFDQAILGEDSSPGRQKVRAAITALRAQTDTLVEVATALGIQLNLE